MFSSSTAEAATGRDKEKLSDEEDKADKDESAETNSKSLHVGLDGIANFTMGVCYVALVPGILYTYDLNLMNGGPGRNEVLLIIRLPITNSDQ